MLTRGDIVGAGSQTLVVEECPTCAVIYAIPQLLKDKALQHRGPSGKSIHCPNGHSWHYTGKTEAEKLREQLERERERAGRITADRDQIEASLRATRGVVTRMKNRASAGVCPCCNRTFQQLARHMQAKHPEFRES